MSKIIAFLEQLNFSYPQSLLGAYFTEIIALLAIVFGGAFLLFGYQHHRYFLGITGFFIGGFLGLLLKHVLSPDGVIVPFIYMTVFAVLCMLIAITFERFMGIFLGGFLGACLALIVFPSLFAPGKETYISLSVAFMLGGGLGAIFPHIFFIINSSLIGTTFVTFGVSKIIIRSFLPETSSHTQALVHLLVFLPIFVFGILYQMKTTSDTTKSSSRQTAKTESAKA